MSEKINALKDYLKSRIQDVDNCYEREIKVYYDETIKSLNTSLLSKKEKEQLINKRNCILVQKHCYEEILEFLEDRKKETNDRNRRI